MTVPCRRLTPGSMMPVYCQYVIVCVQSLGPGPQHRFVLMPVKICHGKNMVVGHRWNYALKFIHCNKLKAAVGQWLWTGRCHLCHKSLVLLRAIKDDDIIIWILLYFMTSLSAVFQKKFCFSVIFTGQCESWSDSQTEICLHSCKKKLEQKQYEVSRLNSE